MFDVFLDGCLSDVNCAQNCLLIADVDVSLSEGCSRMFGDLLYEDPVCGICGIECVGLG